MCHLIIDYGTIADEKVSPITSGAFTKKASLHFPADMFTYNPGMCLSARNYLEKTWLIEITLVSRSLVVHIIAGDTERNTFTTMISTVKGLSERPRSNQIGRLTVTSLHSTFWQGTKI